MQALSLCYFSIHNCLLSSGCTPEAPLISYIHFCYCVKSQGVRTLVLGVDQATQCAHSSPARPGPSTCLFRHNTTSLGHTVSIRHAIACRTPDKVLTLTQASYPHKGTYDIYVAASHHSNFPRRSGSPCTSRSPTFP